MDTIYEFPVSKLDIDKLKSPPKDEVTGLEKEPVVLVACGSFSPITHLHLRMFGMFLDCVLFDETTNLSFLIFDEEMAKDRILESKRFYLVGGYFSPTNDKYNKTG